MKVRLEYYFDFSSALVPMSGDVDSAGLKFVSAWREPCFEADGYKEQTFGGESTGAPEKIRTSDLQLRRLPLYPAELRARSSSLALIDTG
jgi:hypothetical protein